MASMHIFTIKSGEISIRTITSIKNIRALITSTSDTDTTVKAGLLIWNIFVITWSDEFTKNTCLRNRAEAGFRVLFGKGYAFTSIAFCIVFTCGGETFVDSFGILRADAVVTVIIISASILTSIFGIEISIFAG